MPRTTPIPTRTLILSGAIGDRGDALIVAEALAAGLTAAGAPAPDICALEEPSPGASEARELLDGIGFDARMRASRAVLLAVMALEEATLEGSLAFEAATRARQSGVPCFAVTAANRLNGFDLRILDLQLVIEAGTPRALRAAGRRLARII